MSFAQTAISQTTDSTQVATHLSGTVSLTNNGISIVPSFSVGQTGGHFHAFNGEKKIQF
jgi:hypothetical protein